MRLAAGLAVAAVLVQSPDDPRGGPGSDDAGAPGPVAGIAGIGGFATVSRVVFLSAPEHPQRLDAVYLFPDRARWAIRRIGGRTTERRAVYRFGEHVYEQAPGGRSREFQGIDRDASLLQMELRRAVTMWPDGFAWTGAEGNGEGGARVRTAPVRLRSEDDAPSIGSLEARTEGGRLLRIDARRADGSLKESLVVDGWRREGERLWPAELRLENGGETVWRETVEEVDTRRFYVDLYFLPPDRRLRGGGLPGEDVASLDLQATTHRVRELPAGVGWDEALARARRWIEEAASELEPRGLAVDPVPTLELSADATPVRCLVRLAEWVEDPPEGWTSRDERPGLGLILRGPGPPDRGTLARLAASLPPGTRGGHAYCRVAGTPQAPLAEVYLPLERRD